MTPIDWPRDVVLRGSSHPWWLVRFDKLVTNDGAAYGYGLIASRWKGRSLDDAVGTCAFLLLASDEQMPENESVNAFPFAAWIDVRTTAE